MPVRRVPGGYQWGRVGKVYPTREQAERQGRAIYAKGWREKKKGEKMDVGKRYAKEIEGSDPGLAEILTGGTDAIPMSAFDLKEAAAQGAEMVLLRIKKGDDVEWVYVSHDEWSVEEIPSIDDADPVKVLIIHV